MKKLFVMLAALLAIAAPKAAQAFDYEGMYVGGFAGLNFLQYDHKHVDVDFKVGWVAGAHAGYRFCSGLRAEAEASFRYNKLNSVKVSGFSTVHINGHVRTWSLMANAYYDINPCCWCITPYLGGGIGYDWTKFSGCHVSGTKNGFAWQIIAGGLYPVDDCLEIGLEYRFHHGKEKDLYNHTVDARLNWFF